MEGQESLKAKLAQAQAESIMKTKAEAAENDIKRAGERERRRLERMEKIARVKESISAQIKKTKEAVGEINRKGREKILEGVGTVKAAPEMGKIVATEVGTTVSREAARAAVATERTATNLYNEGVAAKNRAVEATTKKVNDIKERYDASSNALNTRLEEGRRADVLAWRQKQAEARQQVSEAVFGRQEDIDAAAKKASEEKRVWNEKQAEAQQATEATLGRVDTALNEAIVNRPDQRDAEARREWRDRQEASRMEAEDTVLLAKLAVRNAGSGFMGELSRLVVSGGEGLKAAIDKGIEWGKKRGEDSKKIDEGTRKMADALHEPSRY